MEPRGDVAWLFFFIPSRLAGWDLFFIRIVYNTNMDYRRRKQIIIVSILALIFVLLGIGAYYKWFYQASTCFDNKQNQKEQGVDCGGPCSLSCELLTVRKPQVEWAKAVFLKDGFYDLAAKVSNTNPNYGLSKFNYTFKLFDAQNNLIVQKQGSNFILPNQSKYIIEANVASDKKPVKAEMAIDNSAKTDWQRLADNFETPHIYIHDKQFKYLDNQPGQATPQAGTAQASGIIKNNSNFDFDKIAVAVILFDDSKNIIGMNRTEVYTVPAGQDRYFSALWFSPLAGEVSSVDMIADTNLFSDSNFMKRFGTQEKFQQYGPATSN